MKKYDLIVIGSGSAGSVAAQACRKEGWRVAVVDARPFGGTCALRGCDPKKVLVGAAEIVDASHRMKGKGIAEDQAIDWQALMTFKKTFTEPVPDGKVRAFKEAGIDVFHGEAAFVSDHTINVSGELLEADKFLIASGAEPAELPFQGAELLKHSDDFLALGELPKRIIFIGGGYISMEFAHIAARAGSEVHLIHRSDQILKGFDADHVQLLMKRSEEVGIQFHLNTDVTSLMNQGDVYTLKGNQNGKEIEWQADIVIHGAGRTPAIRKLNLTEAGILADEKGIQVNEFLQSISNPHVYAAGDVSASGNRPLTPLAGFESNIVAENLLNGNVKKMKHPITPTIVFTLPKLASVGMTEEEAKEKGYEIKVSDLDMKDWYTYRKANEKAASAKLIIDVENDRLLGAHLISMQADELINHFTTAIHFQLPVSELKQVIFGYPTAASDLQYMI